MLFQNMGIFVDIKSNPMGSPSSSESDIDLAIRRSVDEELALSDDDSNDEPMVVSETRTKDRRSLTPDVLPVVS
jgi:hypothetical protein